jgi:alkylhydroperoxidase/carboxymuconolactone decarboxylase family protein YurZ
MMPSASGRGVIAATQAIRALAARARCVEKVIVAELEERLRRLGIQDEDVIESLFATRLDNIEASGLDPKTHALVRLGALVALGAAPVSFQSNVEAALAAGATEDEIVGALIAVAPIIGIARVISAAPKVALPMGYDIDAALEAVDTEPR